MGKANEGWKHLVQPSTLHIKESIKTYTDQLRQYLTRLQKDSLLRNSVFIMMAGNVGAVIGYLYWIVVARSYMASQVGLASAVVSAMMLTSMLTLLGFGSTLVHLLPKQNNVEEWYVVFNAAIFGSTATSILGGLIAILLFFTFTQFSGIAHNSLYLAIFLISIPMWSLSTLVDAAFMSERASSNVLIRNAIFAVAKLLAVVLFVPLHFGAMGIQLSWLLASSIGLAISFAQIVRLKKGYRINIRRSLLKMKEMFSILVGNHFINICGASSTYLLPFVVTVRLSTSENAYFYATWMLGTQLSVISVSIAVSLFAEGSHSDKNIGEKLKRSLGILTTIFLPLMFILLVFGRQLLSIFGGEYSQKGWTLLMLLTAAAFPDAVTSIYISVLRVQKHLRRAIFLNGAMATTSLTLAWILIPSLGIAGTGVAWLVAQSAGTIFAILDYARRPENHKNTAPHQSYVNQHKKVLPRSSQPVRVSSKDLRIVIRYLWMRLKYPQVKTGLFYLAKGHDIYVAPQSTVEFGKQVEFMRDFSARFHGNVCIGNYVVFERGCTVVAHESVSIGDNTFFGEYVSIHDEQYYGHNHEGNPQSKSSSAPIVIGKGVWVGAKTTIMQGVHIGDHAIIGPNMVVINDVPARAVLGIIQDHPLVEI